MTTTHDAIARAYLNLRDSILSQVTAPIAPPAECQDCEPSSTTADDVDPATIEHVDTCAGVALIAATTRTGRAVLACTPALRPDAGERTHALWWEHVRAHMTGQCPRCLARATGEGASIRHAMACPVADAEQLAEHMDTDGLRAVTYLAQELA